jgi:hypothetical protein
MHRCYLRACARAGGCAQAAVRVCVVLPSAAGGGLSRRRARPRAWGGAGAPHASCRGCAQVALTPLHELRVPVPSTGRLARRCAPAAPPSLLLAHCRLPTLPRMTVGARQPPQRRGTAVRSLFHSHARGVRACARAVGPAAGSAMIKMGRGLAADGRVGCRSPFLCQISSAVLP